MAYTIADMNTAILKSVIDSCKDKPSIIITPIHQFLRDKVMNKDDPNRFQSAIDIFVFVSSFVVNYLIIVYCTDIATKYSCRNIKLFGKPSQIEPSNATSRHKIVYNTK